MLPISNMSAIRLLRSAGRGCGQGHHSTIRANCRGHYYE